MLKLIIVGLLLSMTTTMIVSSHDCKKDDVDCPCEEVCLSSGVTMCYEDFLYLKSNNKIPQRDYIVGKGSCSIRYSTDCICCGSLPHSPVCGTDKLTYINLCELRCVANTNYGILNNLEFKRFGACAETYQETN